MYSIISGALVISLLHAVIPNHWLPIIAIGRKEQWTTAKVTEVTFTCAMAHGISTILIGVVLGCLGAKLDTNVTNFTNIIAPIVLIAMGLIYLPSPQPQAFSHHRGH